MSFRYAQHHSLWCPSRTETQRSRQDAIQHTLSTFQLKTVPIFQKADRLADELAKATAEGSTLREEVKSLQTAMQDAQEREEFLESELEEARALAEDLEENAEAALKKAKSAQQQARSAQQQAKRAQQQVQGAHTQTAAEVEALKDELEQSRKDANGFQTHARDMCLRMSLFS